MKGKMNVLNFNEHPSSKSQKCDVKESTTVYRGVIQVVTAEEQDQENLEDPADINSSDLVIDTVRIVVCLNCRLQIDIVE